MKMNKALSKDIAVFSKKVEYHKREIGKHRDALRELIMDVGSIADTCDQAVEDIERAVDHLSEYL